VLHYAQAVFDGLKAFRSSVGAVVLFRPKDHLACLNVLSARLCISLQGRSLTINQGRIGDWTQRLFEGLTGIQYGKVEDPFGWTMPVSP
jgi:hypothetical protein